MKTEKRDEKVVDALKSLSGVMAGRQGYWTEKEGTRALVEEVDGDRKEKKR